MTGAYANRQQAALRDTLVELRNLRVHFPVTTGLMLKRTVGEVRAVDGVTLSINRGETLGLVGGKRLWQDHPRKSNPNATSTDVRTDNF